MAIDSVDLEAVSDQRAIRPIFVFGISGATWTIMKPMMDRGDLPTLARLKATGVAGVLASIKADGDKHYRPQTAWPTLSTGVVPEKHGITRFFHTAENLRVPTLWDAFLKRGMPVGLFGWPMTWPPKPLNGFVIPCHHARDSSTCPPELASIKEFDRQQQNAVRGMKGARRGSWLQIPRQLFGHRPAMTSWPSLLKTIGQLLVTRNQGYRSLLLRKGKFFLNCGLFLNLYRRFRPKLALFATFYVDLAEHRFWRYHQPELFPDDVQQPQLRSAIEDSYRHVDLMLHHMLRELPADCIIAVVSEHGMAVEPVSPEVGAHAYMIRGTEILRRAQLSPSLRAIPVARWIAFRNHEGEPIGDADVQKLRSIRVIETGLPLFNVEQNGDAEVVIKFHLSNCVPIYQQGELEQLTIECPSGVVTFLDLARRSSPTRSAMHDGRAVLILNGPGLRRGEWLEGASILDVTPTLLAVAGIEVDFPIDGKVLDVFERE